MRIKGEQTPIQKERMVSYLLQETRYTRTELELLKPEILKRWYKEEKAVNSH